MVSVTSVKVISVGGVSDVSGSGFLWWMQFLVLLYLGALSVRLSEVSLVLIPACSVRYNCLLYLVVVSIIVLSHHILCSVMAGAD